jgi:hypothetical protein
LYSSKFNSVPFLVSFLLPILWKTEIPVVLRHRYLKSWRRSQGWFYVQIGIYFISVDALNFTITWPKERDNSQGRGNPRSVFLIRHLQESCCSDQHYTECYNKRFPIATQDRYIKLYGELQHSEYEEVIFGVKWLNIFTV